MNTFALVITYLSQYNTDVTCLLSGTAVKAVVLYVLDYISKLSLKTYQIFTAVYDVFTDEILGRDVNLHEKARVLMRHLCQTQ
jgi:hypothetical protein